jgi:beta-lactamase superfamily II metal-dependent hydrolase
MLTNSAHLEEVPMPRSACLEIYEFNVGQGDSTLIINRNLAKAAESIENDRGSIAVPDDPIDYVPYALANDISLQGTAEKALLIDAGDDEYGGDVVSSMQRLGVLDPDPSDSPADVPNLYLMVSHYHDDHMAGLRSIFKVRVEPTRKGEKVTFVERYRPGRVYQISRNAKADPKTFRFAAFQDDLITAYVTAGPQICLIDPGGFEAGERKTMEIDLGAGVDGIPIKLHVLAAAQAVYDRLINSTIQIPSVTRTVDQNDRSIALVLEYGSFRYFLGGDIAGNGGPAGGNLGTNAADPSTKKYFSTHADVESTLGPALESFFPATRKARANAPKYPNAGYCTVMKADHHGSSSSVDVHFLATLRPSIVVVSSGVKTRFHSHPTQQAIDRMSSAATSDWGLRSVNKTTPNTIEQVYLTEVAERVKGKQFTTDLRGGRILGDIVVRPVDESIQNIQQRSRKGAELEVQVYGSGGQTTLTDPRSALRATEPVDNKSIYPIGPWYHTDIH